MAPEERGPTTEQMVGSGQIEETPPGLRRGAPARKGERA